MTQSQREVLSHRWQERSCNASAHALAVTHKGKLDKGIMAGVGNRLNLGLDALL
jgi:hypothetical protein